MSELKSGDEISNFSILSVKSIEEYHARTIYARHRTGCLLYHVHTEDPENLFSFAFRTPPENNRGTAHIIEHSVLAGSRSFPVKDPFIELLKGSVHTFLNAMTYPDKTVYPASSTVRADYFNLMRVYGDAVFFPLLRKEIFHQEGRRLELRPDGKLDVVGVVYNEMLGNYGEHDSIVGEWSYRSLFPESRYRFDSGGEPEAIRELTYEELKRFHETYYHPSNCLVFLYGDIATEAQLEFIDRELLASFPPKEMSFELERQARWSAPRTLTVTCPATEGDEDAGRTSITMNWLIGDVLDPKLVLSMEVLSEILIGNAGAPLQKAIVESGLGDDLSPQSGLETDIKEMVYTVGVRGTSAERREEFERLVGRELEKLVHDGIPDDVRRGALKRVEFRNREIPGGVPFGLRLMGKTLRGWLHGTAPETTLEFTKWMEEVKRSAAAGPYFEELIRTLLLENPHRSTLIVVPDPELAARKQQELADWLDRKRSSMSDAEREELRADNEAFRRFQDQPDRPEDVAKIPFLSLADIPREVDRVDTRVGSAGDVQLLTHELFTNGIVYIDLAFDLEHIGGAHAQYLPLFSRSICGLGFPGVPYDEVARQLALRTGGVFAFLEAAGMPDDRDRAASYLFVRLKVLEDDVSGGVDLLLNMLLHSDFGDERRLHDLLLEMRNDFKSSILPRGSSYAALRAASRLSRVLEREEEWSGTSQLLFLDGLARRAGSERELASVLTELRRMVFARDVLCVNVTAQSAGPATREAERLVRQLPPSALRLSSNGRGSGRAKNGYAIESFLVPSDVGYAATALPASTMDRPEHAHEALLGHLLRTEYLWEKIRMRGGAYGTSAGANGTEGLFSFSSYRDPNIVASLGVFRDALAAFATNRVEPDVLTKAILGSIGHELRPMAPGEKSLVAMRRRLYGITDEIRQAKRDAMLAATPEDLSRAAERLLARYGESASAVIAGRETLKDARARRSDVAEPVALPL